MALTAGPRLPGAAIFNGSIGTQYWDNPTAIGSFNTTTYAEATGANQHTFYLIAYNFGFTIPDDAVPSNILVEAHRGTEGPPGTVSGAFIDEYVVMYRAGVIQTFNAAVHNWSGGPSTYTWNGGGLWDQDWTAADFNHTGFGVAFAGELVPFSGYLSTLARYYWVRITITYTVFGVEFKQSSLVNFLC